MRVVLSTGLVGTCRMNTSRQHGIVGEFYRAPWQLMENFHCVSIAIDRILIAIGTNLAEHIVLYRGAVKSMIVRNLMSCYFTPFFFSETKKTSLIWRSNYFSKVIEFLFFGGGWAGFEILNFWENMMISEWYSVFVSTKQNGQTNTNVVKNGSSILRNISYF